MSRIAFRAWILVLSIVVVSSTACASRDPAAGPGRRPPGAHVTIRVPVDAPTISAAVSLAQPGDLVLIAPGRYDESVAATTPAITIRGESRDGVVIDGRLQQANGVVVTAPGVAVENLTVTHNLQNGVLVTGSTRAVADMPGAGGYDVGDESVRFLSSFLVSHVTATGNGLYGIYAFSAQNGVIEQSYASGDADSGLYVGQCAPCRVVVRDNVAELNAVGYEGTNASGDMYVVGNRLVGNRVGLTTNSDHQEKLLPQRGSVAAGNLVAANQQAATPEQADGGWGIGVGIDGGSGNRIVGNRITGHVRAGVVITASQDLPPDDNQVTGNVFAADAVDVAATFPTATKGHDNCVDGTVRTAPPVLAAMAPCPATGHAETPASRPTSPVPDPGIPFSQVAAPPLQPQLPNATTTGPTSVPAVPPLPDLRDAAVPGPSLLADRALVAAP